MESELRKVEIDTNMRSKNREKESFDGMRVSPPHQGNAMGYGNANLQYKGHVSFITPQLEIQYHPKTHRDSINKKVESKEGGVSGEVMKSSFASKGAE